MAPLFTTMHSHPSLPFNRRPVLRTACLLALAGVAAAGAQSLLAAAPQDRVELRRDERPINRTGGEAASFSPVVKRVAPSVVKVTTATKARRTAATTGLPPGFDHPLMRPFFGPGAPRLELPPQAGLGSGVILSPDGYIVTNNHVIQGADEVSVQMDDGRDFKARVVGRDPQTDIAVLKVEASDLPAATVADSDRVEVGDRVLAIGNPFGIGETVTTGIVSALGRRAGIGLEYEDFVQTDAAINPGNSGGALVDIEGRLIGINTAILSRTGGFQGVGLAVPSNLVSQVVNGLVAHGKVVRGYLGVSAQDLTPALAETLKLDDRRGALVAEVRPQSPAAKAGIRTGDVIVSVNGEPVEDAHRLTFRVGAIAPGTKLELSILRDGEQKTLRATAAERPALLAAAGPDGAPEASADTGALAGVTFGDLSPEQRRRLNVPARVEGALVTGVAHESAAAKAGIRPGDLVLEINRQPVRSAEDAAAVIVAGSDARTLLRLYSRGASRYVVVDEREAAQ